MSELLKGKVKTREFMGAKLWSFGVGAVDWGLRIWYD